MIDDEYGVRIVSFSKKRKAAALRLVKRKKRLVELVSRMRPAQPRRTILDPVEYDGSVPSPSLPPPSLQRLLRRHQ